MSFENLAVVENEHWLEVTIQRPKALNALNGQTMVELAAVTRQLEEDQDLRGMILTGAGEKAFVAGADIGELTDLDAGQAARFSLQGQAVFTAIERASRPVIAGVNGFALGGGCELALACHLRVLARTARIGLPEVGLGVIPGYGGTQRLARIVGLGRALEILLTGDMITAEEAYRIGFANRVVEPENLLETCREIARAIDKRGPRAVSLALQAAVRGGAMPIEEGLAFEASLFGLAAATEDWKEGTAAFLGKRAPEFRGR
ncbi:MAG: enoyl-CoA hydratase-related protein [Candidatus Eisenbacteria bacterium]|nr:enoyl-CoA hydratase/isomerase family protein [Phycisphaerales bacterium]